MKVLISRVINDNSDIKVIFSTEYGSAEAFWSDEEPIEGNDYHIEVDVNGALAWGKNVLKSEIDEFSIKMENEAIYISGSIDSVDADGYAVLRLGDSIVPFFSIGEPFAIGTYITLSAESIVLSPIDY